MAGRRTPRCVRRPRPGSVCHPGVPIARSTVRLGRPLTYLFETELFVPGLFDALGLRDLARAARSKDSRRRLVRCAPPLGSGSRSVTRRRAPRRHPVGRRFIAEGSGCGSSGDGSHPELRTLLLSPPVPHPRARCSTRGCGTLVAARTARDPLVAAAPYRAWPRPKACVGSAAVRDHRARCAAPWTDALAYGSARPHARPSEPSPRRVVGDVASAPLASRRSGTRSPLVSIERKRMLGSSTVRDAVSDGSRTVSTRCRALRVERANAGRPCDRAVRGGPRATTVVAFGGDAPSTSGQRSAGLPPR